MRCEDCRKAMEELEPKSDAMKDWEVDAFATVLGAKLDLVATRDYPERFEWGRKRIRNWTRRLSGIMKDKPAT